MKLKYTVALAFLLCACWLPAARAATIPAPEFGLVPNPCSGWPANQQIPYYGGPFFTCLTAAELASYTNASVSSGSPPPNIWCRAGATYHASGSWSCNHNDTEAVYSAMVVNCNWAGAAVLGCSNFGPLTLATALSEFYEGVADLSEIISLGAAITSRTPGWDTACVFLSSIPSKSLLASAAELAFGEGCRLLPMFGGALKQPIVQLISPNVANRTVTLNGVATAPSGQVRDMTITWGDGSAPMTGGFPFVHSYTTAGVFSALVNVTDSNGRTASGDVTITLK